MREEARQAELKERFKFTMLKSMFGGVWEGMGYVTMMVAFSAYSYTGQALTADVAFPALALFDILRMPMIMMPNIIGSMVTAHTAVGRVASFLDSARVHEDAVRELPPAPLRAPGPPSPGPRTRSCRPAASSARARRSSAPRRRRS